MPLPTPPTQSFHLHRLQEWCNSHHYLWETTSPDDGDGDGDGSMNNTLRATLGQLYEEFVPYLIGTKGLHNIVKGYYNSNIHSLLKPSSPPPCR